MKIFEWHNMTSLREIEKVIQDIELAKLTTNKSFKILPLTLLSVIKRLHQRHFNNFLNSGFIPYPSRNSSKQEDSRFLAKNSNIVSIKFSSVATMDFTHALFEVIRSANDSTNSLSMENIGSIGSHQVSDAVSTVCRSYLINPDKEWASADDYIRVINLAGHFD